MFERGSPGFPAAAQLYNPRFDSVLPSAVARPIDSVDVRNAIRYTVGHGVPVRARSGGHSYAGYSTLSGGIVLDLRELNAITVNTGARTATVGAGAQLIDVSAALASAGATLPAGSRPSVGISGVTLGGGFGLAGRHFGLTADNLVGAKIVTADGALRTVNASSDPDLLWALKGGGGGNFGIVTEFTFDDPPTPVERGVLQRRVAMVIGGRGDRRLAIVGAAHDRPRNLNPAPELGQQSVDHRQRTVPRGPRRHCRACWTPCSPCPARSSTSHLDMAYLPLQLLLAGRAGKLLAACHTVGTAPHGTLPRNTFNAKSDYVATPLPHTGRAAMIAAVEASGSGSLLCDSYGGAVNRVAPTATAFVHRRELFCIQYYGNGASASWIDQAWTKMRPYVSGQAYQNYIDPTLRSWPQAYYGENLARLEQTRSRIDPHQYFNFPQAIGS